MALERSVRLYVGSSRTTSLGEFSAPMVQRRTLPVLPLRGTVVFPGLTAPIAAGRPGTLRAIEAALRADRLVFAVAQRDNTDEPAPEILYSMGVVARIGQIQRGLGGVQLLLQGEHRATALQFSTTEGYLNAVIVDVEEMKPINDQDQAFVALYKEIRERAGELGERRGLPEEVVHQVLDSVTDPGRFADLVAGYIDLPTPEKQGLLEILSVEERLRRVLVHVQKQIGMIEMQDEIKSQVQEELGERQREMFLREQMKAIRKELGEGDDGTEVEDLRKRFEARDPEPGPESREQDPYGPKDVKDQVLEFLAVRQLRQRSPDAVAQGNEDDKQTRGQVLLFVGPPGVGKTSIAKSIARAMGRPYVRISLGGARDEADIRGHRRTYVGAMPGRIIQGMKQAGAKNPVFLLDEVDKLGVSFQGDPAAALLEVLDPAQNDSFTDHYLGVPFDLSEVLFIATANFPQSIPGPLLDRLETVNFAGYTEREKLEIARRSSRLK